MKNITIVTGGTSGLGKALVKELVSQGKDVCIIARQHQKILNVLEEYGCNLIGYSGCLEDEYFVKKVFKELKEKGYYINTLYNCAGVGIFGTPEDMDLNKINQVMNSNVIGLMNITYETCKNMSTGGLIVNVMSTAGLKGNPNESLYCASKWAVRGFTEAMKAYYKKSNIKIVGVYPGGMNTPFWTPNCGLSPDVSKFMDPEEVAKAIVYNMQNWQTMHIADLVIERR